MSFSLGATSAAVFLPPSSAGPELTLPENCQITGCYNYLYRKYHLGSVKRKIHTPNHFCLYTEFNLPTTRSLYDFSTHASCSSQGG